MSLFAIGNPENDTKYLLNILETMNSNQSFRFKKVMETPETKSGANNDLINMVSDRFDGIHFSTCELDKFAKAMYQPMHEYYLI